MVAKGTVLMWKVGAVLFVCKNKNQLQSQKSNSISKSKLIHNFQKTNIMKKQIIYLVTLFALAIASCSKNDDPAPAPPAVNPIEISSFGPATGPKNTVVTITGKGFSGNATSNTVTLNDKVCPVLQASTTQLTISVPPKSATGNFKVTVNGFSQESSVFTYVDTVTVSTLAGSTNGFANGQGPSAQFKTPDDLAVDASGNIFVADVINHVIRKITSTGAVSTIAGSTLGFADGQGSAARFNSPSGLTIDSSGNLYVSDTNNNKIRKISPTGLVTTLAGSTAGFADGQGSSDQFDGPSKIVVDASGNLYVADLFNHKIRKISPSGIVTTLAGSTAGFVDGQGAAAQFNFPDYIAIDALGNIYVADTDNSKIRKITTQGLVSTFAGSTYGFSDGQSVTAQFSVPQGMCLDVAGNLYVADLENHKIRKITTTGIVTTLAGSTAGFEDGIGISAKFKFPNGICIDGNGVLYVADSNNYKIRKIVID